MLTDLLNDWQLNNPPPFEGIRLLGYPWNPSSHQVKNFLARNNVPYLWLEIEKNKEANRLFKLAGDPAPDLPYLVFPDGFVLEQFLACSLSDYPPMGENVVPAGKLERRADVLLYKQHCDTGTPDFPYALE